MKGLKSVREVCFIKMEKNIKRKHSYIKSSYSAVEMKAQMERFDKLCKHFYNVVQIDAKSEVATKALHETLHQYNSNLPTMDDTTGIRKESFNADSNANTNTKLRSPLHVNRKCRPPAKRKLYVSETFLKKGRNKTKQSDDKETTTVCLFFRNYCCLYAYVVYITILILFYTE
jgi:hypothetical protein